MNVIEIRVKRSFQPPAGPASGSISPDIIPHELGPLAGIKMGHVIYGQEGEKKKIMLCFASWLKSKPFELIKM